MRLVHIVMRKIRQKTGIWRYCEHAMNFTTSLFPAALFCSGKFGNKEF